MFNYCTDFQNDLSTGCMKLLTISFLGLGVAVPLQFGVVYSWMFSILCVYLSVVYSSILCATPLDCSFVLVVISILV